MKLEEKWLHCPGGEGWGVDRPQEAVLWDPESQAALGGMRLAQHPFFCVTENGCHSVIIFVCLFFHKPLSSICYAPGTVLGPAETIRQKPRPCLPEGHRRRKGSP